MFGVAFWSKHTKHPGLYGDLENFSHFTVEVVGAQ